MDYNNLLKNKTALVTAGANGIGYAIAKKFEESGAKIFVCDINQDAVDMVNKNHQNIQAISVSYTHLTLPTRSYV